MSKIEKFQLNLFKDSESNKSIEVYEIGDGFVIMRVMNEYIKYGYINIHGKVKLGEISRWNNSQIYDPKNRKQYPNLEKDARKQAFAILSKQAAEKNPAIKAKKYQKDPRQKDLF